MVQQSLFGFTCFNAQILNEETFLIKKGKAFLLMHNILHSPKQDVYFEWEISRICLKT